MPQHDRKGLTMDSLNAWKDGEFAYCVNLVRMQGNRSVERDINVCASYLELQGIDAANDAEFGIAGRLLIAAYFLRHGSYKGNDPWLLALRHMTR